jgi:transposase
MDKKIIQKAGKYFTLEERHKIIEELISTQCSKKELWKKYTGENKEHGRILEWMKQLGYNTTMYVKRPTIASNTFVMPKDTNIEPAVVAASEEVLDIFQVKEKNTQLEEQLKDAELKAIAFSMMIDIAEKEFKIPIRKKLTTKP